MLRAYALADLFNSNLDSNTEGIFLTSRGGNLCGISSTLSPVLAKKASVLGGLTWRCYMDDESSPVNVQPLKVLRFHASSTGSASGLLTECDRRTLALSNARDDLLVGVLGHERQDGGNSQAARDEGVDTHSDKTVNEAEDEEEDDHKGRCAKALLLKAEALAEYLDEELKGFKMPKELR